MAGTTPAYLADQILKHISKLATYTPVTTVYAALCSSAPTEATAGTELTTGTATGYARVALTLASTFTETAQTLTTALAILFPQNTGSSAWPSCQWVEFYDAATAGNRCLPWIVLGSGVACPVNEQVSVTSGATTITAS
ncbi:MAG: hypothetical protein ACLQUT_07900 [Thermoleophilia bacterium]